MNGRGPKKGVRAALAPPFSTPFRELRKSYNLDYSKDVGSTSTRQPSNL
jgi:hypothetical protein